MSSIGDSSSQMRFGGDLCLEQSGLANIPCQWRVLSCLQLAVHGHSDTPARDGRGLTVQDVLRRYEAEGCHTLQESGCTVWAMGIPLPGEAIFKCCVPLDKVQGSAAVQGRVRTWGPRDGCMVVCIPTAVAFNLLMAQVRRAGWACVLTDPRGRPMGLGLFLDACALYRLRLMRRTLQSSSPAASQAGPWRLCLIASPLWQSFKGALGHELGHTPLECMCGMRFRL
eukprot:42645-Amphidinium_carterae.2